MLDTCKCKHNCKTITAYTDLAILLYSSKFSDLASGLNYLFCIQIILSNPKFISYVMTLKKVVAKKKQF